MNGPDPTTLLDWSHDSGTFVAQHGPDTIHVGKATKHQWRWRVTGPTRGTTIGHALKPHDAMMAALRNVGHPEATTPHDENGKPLIDRDDRGQRLLSARERFCDRIEAEDGMSLAAVVHSLEALLDYLHMVEARALERESHPVNAERVEFGREDMALDALDDAVGEAREEAEREGVEVP